MVENIERHLHEGKRPMQAAREAARELVGPIIAMTITLAAVYAPIGIQGGLTGALFREFAFTLAGAVIVSGVVALTLSPMMGSRLLRAGDTERGFAGWINRRFDSLRHGYTRVLAGSLAYRPVVLALWLIVAALIVPFYMFSQQELAPAEDQGVVFSIIQAAPNATIEQTKLFARQINAVYKAQPETAGTFELTFPNGGFGGMVTKPWSERTKTAQQLQMEVAGPLSQIPGVRAFPTTPPALPGGGDFPVDLVIASPGEPQQLVEIAEPAGGEGVCQRPVHVRRRRSEIRSAAGRGRVRSRQAAIARRRSQPGRPRSVDPAGWRLRQSLQHSGPQLQGHPANRAGGTADAGSAVADLHHGIGRQARAALDLCDAEDHRGAARAEEVPAAQRGADPGRDSAAGAARYGARIPRNRSARDSASGFHAGLRGRITTAQDGRRQLPVHVPAVGRADLPGARGAVRELPRSVHHSRSGRCRSRSRARCCSRSLASRR